MRVQQVKGSFTGNFPPPALVAAMSEAPCRVLEYQGPTTESLARHSFAFPALRLDNRAEYPLDGWLTEPCKPAL